MLGESNNYEAKHPLPILPIPFFSFLYPRNTMFAKSSTQRYLFPPSSLVSPKLTRCRSSELVVSPKKVVGCKGGSRYVEGCCEFPHLKIEKLPFSHFMFFDRNEIHIQDFGDLFTGIFIISPVPVFDFSTFQYFRNHKFGKS